jgi:hypothetical protein
MLSCRSLPEFVKAGRARRRQRSLAVRRWDDFQRDGPPFDSVAVVGNAGYLKDIDQGEIIDGHSLVIRLNNFQTRGFEGQVGTRCDVFLTNFFRDILYERPELAAAGRIVASVPNNFRKARRSHLHHRHAEHIAEGMAHLAGRDVYVPSLETFLAACSDCRAVPSTGFMAVCFVLRHLRWNRLFVTGFSFFRGAEHYFGEEAAPRPRHDFDRERQLFAGLLLPLVAAGTVRLDVVMQRDLVEAAR